MSVVPTFAPSMTASAGTSATKPLAANEAIISPVAVLLWRTAVTPSPAAAALTRLRSALGEETPQIGAEGALHPALHHMDAPQQQRDRAGEIEEAERRVHRALLRQRKRIGEQTEMGPIAFQSRRQGNASDLTPDRRPN